MTSVDESVQDPRTRTGEDVSVSHAASMMTDSSAPEGARLVSWAESLGGRVSKKVGFLLPCNGDRTCVAHSAVHEDELIVEMPKTVVFASPPCEPPVGVSSSLVALLGRTVERRNVAVALLLHHEHMRGDVSEFSTYIGCLPRSFPMPFLQTVPGTVTESSSTDAASDKVNVTSDERDLYCGTGVELLAQSGASLCDLHGVMLMERLIEELDPEGMWWHKAQRSRAALQWAAAAVQSRAHASRNGTALVPLADAFNHSCSPNAEVFEGTTTFQVRALRIIDPGEELTISYGHFSNSELLFNAGFVLDVNPDDCILVSRRELLEAAHRRWIDKGEEPPADLSERCEALGAGMPPPRLRAVLPLLGGAIPPRAVTMLAGLLVSRDTWAQFEEGGLGNLHDGWALEQSSTAEALRSDVTHAVYDLIEAVLRPRYAGTTVEADRIALATMTHAVDRGAAERRRQQILQVRLGERALLEKLSDAVQSRLGMKAATSGEPVAKRSRR